MKKLTKKQLCADIPVKVHKNLYRVVYETHWNKNELKAVVAEDEIEVARYVREQRNTEATITLIELVQKEVLA